MWDPKLQALHEKLWDAPRNTRADELARNDIRGEIRRLETQERRITTCSGYETINKMKGKVYNNGV